MEQPFQPYKKAAILERMSFRLMQRLEGTLMDHLGPAIAGTSPTQTIIPPSLEHSGGGAAMSPQDS